MNKFMFIALLALFTLAACGGATAQQNADPGPVITVYKSPT